MSTDIENLARMLNSSDLREQGIEIMVSKDIHTDSTILEARVTLRAKVQISETNILAGGGSLIGMATDNIVEDLKRAILSRMFPNQVPPREVELAANNLRAAVEHGPNDYVKYEIEKALEFLNKTNGEEKK